MFESIKNIFGLAPKTDYHELVKQGALILDVRSKGEYLGGHIKNSVNIPVDQLSNNLSKLNDKDQCIICCCASGMRSGTAKKFLESHGYKQVYNGGGWSSLEAKIGS